MTPGEITETLGFGPVWLHDDFAPTDPAADHGPDPHAIDQAERSPLLDRLRRGDFEDSGIRKLFGNSIRNTVMQAVLLFVWACSVPAE